MGAVHGVYLKYVGLSAASFAGYQLATGNIGPMEPLSSLSPGGIAVLATGGGSGGGVPSLLRLGAASVLGYSALLNGAVAIMFKLRRGMSLIGKDTRRGTIPLWSYALFFPFHVPTYAYTWVHTRYGKMRPHEKDATSKKKRDGGTAIGKVPVPVASEVQPGWWVGGCYANRLGSRRWAAIVDLTVEFPERCIDGAARYLCLPTWDGVPCSPSQLETAAAFCAEAREEWTRRGEEGEPHVLIHCAHGRGRSTTVMCAALVRAGLFPNWEEALEDGIRPGRPVCKLNASMRRNLTEWQGIYVDGKKGT